MSAAVNKKFSAKDRLTLGMMGDAIHYSYNDSLLDGEHGYIPYLNERGSKQLLRAYGQWQHRFSERFTLNTGFYSQYLTLNKKLSAESRLGLRYRTNTGTISMAYGRHSQMQALATYFMQTKVGNHYLQTNRGLDFTKSHHVVAGWEQPLAKGWSYKLEAYTQLLDLCLLKAVHLTGPRLILAPATR